MIVPASEISWSVAGGGSVELPLSFGPSSVPAPAKWRWRRLTDVCRLETGHTPSRRHPEYWNGDIEWVSIADVRDDQMYVQATAESVTRAGIENSAARILPAGTVLLSRGPTIGKTCILPRPMATNQSFVAWVPTGQVEPVLLYYLLKAARSILIEQGAGSTMSTIYMPDLRRIEVCLPPLAEHRRLVAHLKEQMTHIARARAAAKERLEAAKTLSDAMLAEAFADGSTRDWPRLRLGDCTQTASGATPRRGRSDYYDGKIPWVKTGELKDCDICETEETVTELALAETSLRLLPVGTLLIAMYGQGQTRGRTGRLAIPATTNQACFAVIPNDKIDTEYLQLWFRSRYQRLREQTEGRGGNQPNLNGVVLRDLLIPLPRIQTQRAVAKRLGSSLERSAVVAAVVENELTAIDLLPAALLRAAFTGDN